MTTDLKLLAVFAHPDDESMGMGGTLAKYSAHGVETHLICATRGEIAWKEWVITTRIDMAEHCLTALHAVRCHQTQLSTLGSLAEMPRDAATTVFAMQGTFYRALSLVNGGRKLETDLFENIQ